MGKMLTFLLRVVQVKSMKSPRPKTKKLEKKWMIELEKR